MHHSYAERFERWNLAGCAESHERIGVVPRLIQDRDENLAYSRPYEGNGLMKIWRTSGKYREHFEQMIRKAPVLRKAFCSIRFRLASLNWYTLPCE